MLKFVGVITEIDKLESRLRKILNQGSQLSHNVPRYYLSWLFKKSNS